MNTQSQSAAGSTGNVIAAVCSFFIPGLGHLVQGRIMGALFFFISCAVLYAMSTLVIPLFFAVPLHLWAIITTATYKPEA